MSKKTNVVVSTGLESAVLAVRKVRENLGVAYLDGLAVLKVSGPDAVPFLQNRLTNDVLALQPGQGQLNTALDRQAKIQGIFSLFRNDAGFFLLVDQAETENTVSQILKYRIVEQVELLDVTGQCHVFSVQGPKSEALLKEIFTGNPLPSVEFSWVTGQAFDRSVCLIQRSLSGETGFLLLVETSDATAFLEKLKSATASLDGIEMSSEVQEALRIEASIPRFGKDYDFETLLPETGLERQAVSYSKGCYLGQETVARVKTYGLVQRALIGLLFEESAAVPPEKTDCLLEGKVVGTIQSAVFSPTLKRPIAMAYLGKNERIPGRQLDLTIDGKAFKATVALLPFYDARDTNRSAKDLLNEGLKLFSDGFDEEAIRLLQEAIQRDANLVEAYEALGVILARHDRFDEAIAMMDSILKLDPDHVLAHTNLSVFYMKKGDKEKAEEEKAKATMAAFSKKAKESGLVFDIEAERRKKEQTMQDRIAMFEEALQFNLDDPLGNFGLGSAYLELKRYSEAILPFEKMLKAQPRHTVAYLSLGKALEGIGESLRAKEIYTKGVEVAAAKGDLMPLKEMQARLDHLTGEKTL